MHGPGEEATTAAARAHAARGVVRIQQTAAEENGKECVKLRLWNNRASLTRPRASGVLAFLQVSLLLCAAVVLASGRRRYRIRYLDEDEVDESPVVFRRSRDRDLLRDLEAMASSSERSGPVYVIRRRRPKERRLPNHGSRERVRFEEPPEDFDAEESRRPGPPLPGSDPFRPSFVVQGTYALHPRSQKLMPYEGRPHIPIPREVFSEIS
ncbi:uncharacterized protein LOC144160617 [Haemaphysalis longicornis]